MYNTIILPTMRLSHVVLIIISSRPVDKNSPMYRLMEKKWPESGKPIIKTLIFTTICDMCRIKGNMDCKHSQEDPWSSDAQNRKLKYLLSDNKAEYMREMRNEEVDDDNEPAFSYESVKRLEESKIDYGGNVEQPYVYIAIDAAAGGTGSHYAIFSCIFRLVYDKETDTYREQMVITGADLCNSKQFKTVYEIIAMHMRKLRTFPGLASSLYVLMPENNLAFEADHMSDYIASTVQHGYYVMQEKENERGFKTDNMLKQAMATAFRKELDDDNVRFHNKFFTLTTPEGKLVDARLKNIQDLDSMELSPGSRKPLYFVYREAAENMRDELCGQLIRYTRYIKPSRDEFKEPTIIYSGKPTGPDDLAVMIQAANTMHKYFLTREKHKVVHRHQARK